MTAAPSSTQRSQPEADGLRHTALPWKFSPWHIEEGPPAVLAPAGHIVCTTAGDDDAAFIVEAVNSHAALKSQIKSLEGTIDLLEANARVQAKLLADTGRRAEELTKALEFYAETENWVSPSLGFALQYDPELAPIQKDRGGLARSALLLKGCAGDAAASLIGRTEVAAEAVIPGSEDMEARFDWLQSKAVDMGYALVSTALPESLSEALAEHDHRRTMQVMLTEPKWVGKARTALALSLEQ